MRRLLTLTASLVTLALTLGGCGIIGERGSGTMATETRQVSGFHEIDLSGSGHVLVSVTGTESLTVEAEDNILPLLTSEVRNGRLVLGARRSISPTREIVYTITVVSLEGVSVSGSGIVTATGIDVSGFDVEISGSGTVVPEGVADQIDLSISGSGRFDGDELVSSSGHVSISGSGRAVVKVTDVLDVEVSGSGRVEYLGDPAVTSSISGSGSVSKG